jgi:GNAT superfamily N-acetyltransferase
MNEYEIREYEFEDNLQNDFISLMETIYDNYSHKNYHIATIKKTIDKTNPSFEFVTIKNFIAYKEGIVVGHISAMIDKRQEEDNSQIGIIGFYECIDDDKVSSLLINKAIDYLHKNKCLKIRGPINISIWNTYRFVVDQKDNNSFILEPLTKNYYIKQFSNEGFKVIEEFGSAQRADFNTILSFVKNDYESILKEGYNIRTLTKDNFIQGILSIKEMVQEIFRDSNSFVEISKEEYLYLYEGYEKVLDQTFIHIISNLDGMDVGFCTSIIDPLQKQTIVLKTIGVLPEYQGKKVGAALLYEQHRKAQELGATKEIYALIKMGNIITKLPYPGIEVIRKYVLLENEIV